VDLLDTYQTYELNGSALLVYGVVLLAVGPVHARFARRRPPARGVWVKDLLMLGVPEPVAVPLAAQLADHARRLYRTVRLASAGAYLVVGAGLALATLLGWLAAAGITPATEPGRSLGLVLLMLPLMLGVGLGYPLAVARMPRSAAAGPRYADLRQRRVGDYRPPWHDRLLMAVVAVQVGVALVAGLAGGGWPVALPAGLLVLILVIGQVLLAIAAGVRRVVTAPDPALARRGDDLFRINVVARLHAAECLLLIYACFAVGLTVHSVGQLAQAATVIATVTTFAGAFVLFVLVLLAPSPVDLRRLITLPSG
jgi:hypothetical protein